MNVKRFVLLVLALTVACSREAAGPAKETKNSKPLVVASKNFSESILLGEIIAQKLEANGCQVERRFNMGGTLVCDEAIQSGGIDFYPEYSGTALTAILKQPTENDPHKVNDIVANGYKKRGLMWGPAFGFNNTFAMIVRKSDAQSKGLSSIADLKKVETTFRPGFGYEFAERPDGWKGLLSRYALHFHESPKTMDLGLTYKALASNQVDLIAGNSTDGLIDSLGLVALSDDQHYFPPYDAAIVERSDVDQKCAGATRALAALQKTIDDAAMRKLNYAVDGEKRDVTEVAKQFLNGGAAGSTVSHR